MSGSALEAVSEATHGHQHDRFSRVHLAAGTDALDVHVEGLRVSEVVTPPDPVDELSAGEDSSGVAHEDFEQLELLQRHVDLRTVDRDRVAVDVQADTTALEYPLVELIVGLDHATQHRPHSREQLP